LRKKTFLPKPSASILELADYKSAFGIDGYQKEYMLLTYRNTYKSLDDLNQDELRLWIAYQPNHQYF
jgi:hypothetical protein